MFQSNLDFFMSIQVYIVFIQEIWVHVLARLGAKYAEVGCKVYGYFWVHVYTFWVHVYGSAGCMYAVVGCMPHCR